MATETTRLPNMTELAMQRFLGLDPVPPGAKKIRIRVKSRCAGQVVAGTYVEFGETEHEIYDVHLKHFEALVQDPARLERAREQYDRDLEVHGAAKEGKPGAEWRKQYEPSVEAAYRDMYAADCLPFDEVEVVDGAPKRQAA